MMKRKVAMMMAVVFCIAALAGCGGKTEGSKADVPENSAEVQESEVEETQEKGDAGGEDILIGINFYSITDSLGSAVYDNCNFIADQFDGVENQWQVLSSYDETAQITDCENLINAGVDGLLILPISDNVAGKVADLCEKNGVYLMLCFRNVQDAAVLEKITGYEYFCGWCFEDYAGTAYEMFQMAIEDGGKQGGGIYFEENSALALANAGFRQGFEEGKIEKVTEYTVSGPTDDLGECVTNFLTLYPEMDVIFSAMASNGGGENMLNVLYGSMNTSGTKLYTFDTFEGMKEGFDANVLGCVAGGHYVDAVYAYMTLLNACQGNKLSQEMVNINSNYLLLGNKEEVEAYENYVENKESGFRYYDREDILNMSVNSNPEFSAGKLQEIAGSYSIEELLSKIDEFEK